MLPVTGRSAAPLAYVPSRISARKRRRRQTADAIFRLARRISRPGIIRLPFGLRIHPMAPVLALGMGSGWLIVDRVISGVIQCSALGCLPR